MKSLHIIKYSESQGDLEKQLEANNNGNKPEQKQCSVPGPEGPQTQEMEKPGQIVDATVNNNTITQSLRYIQPPTRSYMNAFVPPALYAFIQSGIPVFECFKFFLAFSFSSFIVWWGFVIFS